MDMVIKTTETTDSTSNTNTIVETVESIKQNSSGFTQGLELLSTVDFFLTCKSTHFYYYLREPSHRCLREPQATMKAEVLESLFLIIPICFC